MARTRPRPKRTRLATGIYADKHGIGIIVRGKEHRYPLGTPLEQLIRKRRDLLDAPAARRGTLAKDCADHLLTVPDGRARNEQKAMLDHWIDVFGPRASGSIEPKEIRAQRAAWLTKGPNGEPFSPKHLNNMLHALRAVYKTNYGQTLNPAADVDVLPVTYHDARAIPDALIDRILDGMSDTAWPVNPKKKAPPANLAKYRLRVMRETGLAQAMLKRVELHHLNFRSREVYVSQRIKGRGVIGATLPLTLAGAAAFKALVKAGGLGPFSTRSLAYAWRRAVNRARDAWTAQEATKARPKPWPLSDDVRAYDLRHSFGTAVLVATGDLEATATLMRHANINTTRRYAQAAANIRAQQAVKALNKATASK